MFKDSFLLLKFRALTSAVPLACLLLLRSGETYTTFKLTSLGLEKPDVPDGMPLCIILTEPCSSLADFCYGGGDWCRFTFFSTDENCCPTGDLLASSDPTQVEVVDTAGGDVEVVELRRRGLLSGDAA